MQIYKFDIVPAIEKGLSPVYNDSSRPAKIDDKGIVISSLLTSKGYNIEVMIPWECFKGFDFSSCPAVPIRSNEFQTIDLHRPLVEGKDRKVLPAQLMHRRTFVESLLQSLRVVVVIGTTDIGLLNHRFYGFFFNFFFVFISFA